MKFCLVVLGIFAMAQAQEDSSNSSIMDTTNAFVAQGLVNPLNPPASVTQGPGEVSDDEFNIRPQS